MMLSDNSSSSSDSDYDSSSTLDLADKIYVLLNDGINNGPGPKQPPIMVNPWMLSRRRTGRFEGIIKSPPRKTNNQLLKNQVLAAKNQMMTNNMQQLNKYGRKSTTDDNILTFNAADKRRVLNIQPKDDVRADESKKKVFVTVDNYARRTLNILPKDDVKADVPMKKVSVTVDNYARRTLNILPKDNVKAAEPKKKVCVTVDNYARRTWNMLPKDDAKAAESKRKISVSGENNRRSVKPVRRSAIQR